MIQLTNDDLSVLFHVDAYTAFLHKEGGVEEVLDGLRKTVWVYEQSEQVDALALRVHGIENFADLFNVRRRRVLRLRLALLLHFLRTCLRRDFLSGPPLRMLAYSVLDFQRSVPKVSSRSDPPNLHELYTGGTSRQRSRHPPDPIPVPQGSLPSTRPAPLSHRFLEFVFLRVIILHLCLLRSHAEYVLHAECC